MTLASTIDRVCKGAYSGEIPFSGYVPPPALVPNPVHRTSDLLFVSFVTAQSPETKKTAIFRPSAILTMNARGKLIAFTNFRESSDPFAKLSWSTPMALWPHNGVADMTVADYSRKRDALLEMYEGEIKAFPEKRALSSAFAEAWQLVAHPIAIPFLKELAPHFHQSVSTPLSMAS